MKSKLIIALSSIIALLVIIILFNIAMSYREKFKDSERQKEALLLNIEKVNADYQQMEVENEEIKSNMDREKTTAKKMENKCVNSIVPFELIRLLQEDSN